MLATALALAVAACGSGGSNSSTSASTTAAPAGKPGAGKPALTLGAKNFTEQFVLGQLYKQALEAKGFTVKLKNNIGSTEIIDKGLTTGNIDIYPEYIGVGLTAVAHDNKSYPTEQAAYNAFKTFQEGRGFTLLEVLVGVVVFAIGLLSLLAGSLMAARAMKESRSFAAATVAAQSTLDSLRAAGWDNIAGASGTYTTKGHAVSWTVSGTDPRKVLVVITRRTSPSLVMDSVMTYVSGTDVVR